MLYNRRYFEQKCVKKINTSFTYIQISFTSSSDDQLFIIIHKIVKIQWTSSASEFLQSQEVMSFIRIFKNIELHAMMSSHLNLITLREISKMSLTLIKDVLDHNLHDDKDWFYNISIQKKQSQRMHHKFWKRALQTRQSESKRWWNNDELHKLQQCWFKDNCKWRWLVTRKQRCKVETLTQWWRECC